MALKILRTRKKRLSSSDSSISSPEPDIKNQKWNLYRAPLVFNKPEAKKTATAPAHTQQNVPITSTPCFKAVPPFQLSQTLLSPVSKEQPEDSFIQPKPRKAPAFNELTFDNVIASQLGPDTSSKLVVNKRVKPVQRRNHEADVERTRHYAGGRIGPQHMFTEDCDDSKWAVPPTKNLLKNKQTDDEHKENSHQAAVTEFSDHVSLHSVGKHSFTQLIISKKVNGSATKIVQQEPKQDIHEVVPHQTAERSAQNSTLMQSKSKKSIIRSLGGDDQNCSLKITGRNCVSNIDLSSNKPAEGNLGVCDCDSSSSETIENEDEENRKKNQTSHISFEQVQQNSPKGTDLQSKSSYGSLQVTRSSPRITEAQNNGSNTSLPAVLRNSSRRMEFQNSISDTSSRPTLRNSDRRVEAQKQISDTSLQAMRNSPRRMEEQNKSLHVSFKPVQQKSPRRKLSSSRKSVSSHEREGVPNEGNFQSKSNEVFSDSDSVEKNDDEPNRKSAEERSAREIGRNVEESSVLLKCMSKMRKRQIVGNISVPIQDEPQDTDPVTAKRIRRNSGRLKNTIVGEVANVSRTPKFLVENRHLEVSGSSSERGDHSSGHVKATTADYPPDGRSSKKQGSAAGRKRSGSDPAKEQSTAQKKRGDPQDPSPLLTELRIQIKQVDESPDRAPDKCVHKGKGLNKDGTKNKMAKKVLNDEKAIRKVTPLKKTYKKLTTQSASVLGSLNLNFSERRPKRERRRPGDYWVAAPNIQETVRKKTGNKSSQSRDVRDDKKGPQSKKRRLLPEKENRKPWQDTLFMSRKSEDEQHASALICHADDVILRNKNSGLSSENSQVRIGSTVSWMSMSGSLNELDPGAISGPQVNIKNHMLLIVMEGTVYFENLSHKTETTLKAADSVVIPSDEIDESHNPVELTADETKIFSHLDCTATHQNYFTPNTPKLVVFIGIE